ncbi:MAG TPA: YqgE/AlgH family protein [Caulobacteraceae bacterium]|nr:YqgE/AlgH family protein [Caulobacteraceae bacterium]
MPQSSDAYLGGRLLVAMPGIEDPRFERAVILVCAHDDDHAMGLSVNRPVEGLTVAHLLGKLGVKPAGEAGADLVLMGGPVEPERGFVLHTDDYRCPQSSPVAGGVMLTATREVLEAIAGKQEHPRRAVMALGYAGWGAGQLEHEIRESVWLTCDADLALLFDEDHEHKWSRALAKIGVSAEHLSAQAGRA